MTELKPRPLALSDILEFGATLVARNLLVFLRITAPLIVPVNLVFIALLLGFGATSTRKPDYLFIAVYVLLIVLFLLALVLAAGASLKAAADIRGGTSASARASLSFVRNRLTSFLWLVALLLVGIGPGVILFFVARTSSLGALGYLALVLIPLSLWLAGIWSVAPPTLLLEEGGVADALRRSRVLVRGSYWRSLWTVILGSILALFVGILGEILASLFPASTDVAQLIVVVCGATLGELVAIPLLAAYLVVLYFDLRVHKDGFRFDRAE